ncbi:MAG: LysR family transcriptional regulator, partial [Granulosicoccus sp.]|nr:LysR family transcriptional regulator [Granulosicoccus sp.]
MNLTEAADSLHMTKGALSYQIKQLEQNLGFDVFLRQHGGIVFTSKGQELYNQVLSSFEKIEQSIDRLQSEQSAHLTVGMTTYFASRWLTPRLMTFTSQYPDIRLRIQPIMGEVDLNRDHIDLAIQWGDGDWSELAVEPLFNCPAFPTAGKETFLKIKKKGLKASLGTFALLHDFDQSTSWEKWLERASMDVAIKSNSLVIPDP